MAKLSNELKVGLLVFAAMILFAVLIFGVGEIDLFRRGYEYHVIFDTASALMKGAQVRVGGVNVGTVRDIDFVEHKGRRRVLVTLAIREDLVLHRQDQFKITMLGLLGDNYVEIEPGPSDAGVLAPGDTVEGGTVFGMEEMFRMVQVGFDKINRLLDEETITNFKTTVGNVESVSTDLAYIMHESRDDITVTLSHLRSSSQRLDAMLRRNEANFDVTMENLAASSGDFRATARSMREISEGLEQGEGTAGKLLKDDALYRELLTTTEDAHGLVKDIQNRPTRYIHLSIF